MPLVLATSKHDSIIIIEPYKQITIEMRGVFKVSGMSLKQISAIYGDWFKSGEIVYQTDVMPVRRAKDFKYVFLLDNQQVFPNDSIAFNRTLPPPNLKADTLFDESQIPTIEPEL